VIWDRIFRAPCLYHQCASNSISLYLRSFPRIAAPFLWLLLLAPVAAVPSLAREKDVLEYGEGLIINIPLPEAEVEQVVDEVAQNTIIRGTKEYNKDEYVAGAIAVPSTPVFPKWTEGGKVFYKVRKQALDPRNFKDSADVGTLAVRYVLQPQGDTNTVLRIDALFVEDFRHSVHQSNGSVESSEYKDIQDRLASIELVKKETAEALRQKQERLAKKNFGLAGDGDSNDAISSSRDDKVVLSTPPSAAAPPESNEPTESASQSPAAPPPLSYDPSQETLEQYVAGLRREVERLVKQPGAPLKSAPFHTASTTKSLDPGAEVLILISTPYWYGVETHDGQHGWLRRDQLEQLP
jgi:hypothetical protein